MKVVPRRRPELVVGRVAAVMRVPEIRTRERRVVPAVGVADVRDHGLAESLRPRSHGVAMRDRLQEAEHDENREDQTDRHRPEGHLHRKDVMATVGPSQADGDPDIPTAGDVRQAVGKGSARPARFRETGGKTKPPLIRTGPERPPPPCR